MKRSLSLMSCALLALYITTATSCKKDDDSPVCRMTTVTNTSGSSTTIINVTYNADGTIAKTEQVGGETKVFSYSGNMINITASTGGIVTGTSAVTLNAQRLVSGVVQKNAAGMVTTTLSMSYDGAGKIQTLVASGSGPATTTTFQFTNGNATTITSGSSITSLSYYADKPFMDGDYLKTVQMLTYGALYIVNNQLVKASTQGSTTNTFAYDYGDGGRITKVTQSNGSATTNTITYQYTCN